MNKPEDAPKDGTVILVDAGYPWLIPATWNEPSKEWCCAIIIVDPYYANGDNTYFQNKHFKKITGWLPMPEK